MLSSILQLNVIHQKKMRSWSLGFIDWVSFIMDYKETTLFTIHVFMDLRHVQQVNYFWFTALFSKMVLTKNQFKWKEINESRCNH